jgi:hypothetical protein
MKNLMIVVILLIGQRLYAQSTIGCALNAINTNAGVLYSSSDDPEIDRATNEELRFLISSFIVTPTFFYYDDSNGMNAFSTPENLNDSQSNDGAICFGLGLLKTQIIQSVGGTNVPVILAHEFAHTVARRFNLNLPTKQNELFADYLAGGYMYYRSVNFKQTDINAAFQSFYKMGDNDFTSPNHHGTPASRVACIRQGYYDCYTAHQQGKVFTLNDGVRMGVTFITNNNFQ